MKKLLNKDAFDKQEVELLLNSISPDAVDEKAGFDSESNFEGTILKQVEESIKYLSTKKNAKYKRIE